VASRTSAFQYKGCAADIREIGARLRVDKILEGSVRRAGERLRVSVQLINVADGYRLWYERYERDMKDLFALQDEVAEQIAQALEVALGERADWGSSDNSLNSRSYELYLQGRQFFHQHRRKAFEIALQTFTQAIQIDPGNARAYAGIADCHSFLNLYFGQGPTTVAAADAASARALELGPDLPEAHASRGLALFLLGQLDLSERHLQQALELAPRHYDSHYIAGRVCFTQGRTAEAARHFRQACTIVPEAFDSWYLLGMCYRRTGENAKARSADLECMEAVKRRVRGHPDDTRAWTMGAAVLAELGEPERAEEWVNRALAVDADEPIIQYNAACVFVSMGKPDKALACLEASAARYGLSLKWMANDPDLDPLRSDPRFQELVRSAGT
jgi:tetratricopeptide (TPR) repeat protein